MSNASGAEKILEVKNLYKEFNIPGRSGRKPMIAKAVRGVSFDIKAGEVFGLIGESGCGKTVTGKMIMKLLEPSSGEIIFENMDMVKMSKHSFRKYRRHIQTVFQNPGASLDPKMSIGTILLEPILLHDTVDTKDSAREVERLLEIVGLDAAIKNALPNELSSGQKQRIAIAKALSTNPRLVVCDEPVSALDVSIQSHILNLLMDVKKQYDMTYLFISHSLGVIRHVSDRIGIMYLGRLIEAGTNEEIFSNPLHPYTRALLSASTLPDPDANKERIILSGEVPSCTQVPDGCPFHPRCPKATAFCSVRLPTEKEVLPGHSVECHLYN